MSFLVKVISYEGRQIRARDDEKVNLTDMWRAAGSDPKKRPAEWLRRDSTIEFSAHLSAMGLAHTGELTEKESGGTTGGGSTWAHWHLALAYARYLDHAFHVWCNEVIRREMQAPTAASVAPRLDESTVSSSRVGESPKESERLRRAVARVRFARGYTTQKVYGFIRKTRHVSSPFFLSSHLLDAVVDDLEMLESGALCLPRGRAVLALPGGSRQTELFKGKAN